MIITFIVFNPIYANLATLIQMQFTELYIPELHIEHEKKKISMQVI